MSLRNVYPRTERALFYLSLILFIFSVAPAYAILGSITGKVTNAEGLGLGGVYVSEYESGNFQGTVITGLDGSYTLNSLPTGSYAICFTASNSGYSEQCFNKKNTQGSADLVSVIAPNTTAGNDAVLTPGGNISGTVVNSAGAGLAALVSVFDTNDNWVTAVFAGQDGNYTISNLLTGNYKVQFSVSTVTGYLSQWYNNKQNKADADFVSVTPSNTTTINVVFDYRGVISGTVTNAYGIGLANVYVTAYQGNTDLFSSQSYTLQDGSYSLTGLITGTYTIELYEAGYITQWYSNKSDQNSADMVAVTAPNTTLVNAVLVHLGSISGRITNAAGTGIANVTVVANLGGSNTSFTTITAQDGSYTLNNLLNGHYRIQFSPQSESGYVSQWYNNKSDPNGADQISVTAPDTITGIDAVLMPGAIISGQVTNAGGTGISNVWVYLWDSSGNSTGLGVGTGQDGSYTITGVPTGNYKIQFVPQYGSGYLNQWYNRKGDFNSADLVSIMAPNTTTVDAVLSAGGTISGIVSNAAGNGIPYVFIDAYDSNGNYYGGYGTDSAGRYAIPHLPTGSYKVYFNPLAPTTGYSSQWYNNKADQLSADVISVTDPNTTTLNIILRPYRWDLGSFDGSQYSAAYGTSADGAVVVGGFGFQPNADYFYSFRWTQSEGMVNLDHYQHQWYSVADGVSADGTVIVGILTRVNGYLTRAFRWTQAEGMVDIGTAPGGANAAAYGVSADGTVIVGTADNAAGNWRAFRWTQAGGVTDLGALPGGANGIGLGVSADGTVIVGVADDSAGNLRAFRWTQAGGMADLGTLPGGANAAAYGVSADGSVIVGAADDSAGNTRAFRWTQTYGMVDIGTIAGGGNAAAYGVSADGTVIVGSTEDSAGNAVAFYWTNAIGMKTIGQWLADIGMATSTGEFSDAYAISADGKTIVGQLSNGQAFRVSINSLSAYHATVAPTGGGKSVNLSAANESWTAVSNVPWITVTSGSSGTGNGTVQYSVASNAGGVRTGTITIAGQTLTVMQGTTLTHAQIGVFRSGAWYVDRDETFGWSGCGPDGCYAYGMAGDHAVTGDWDGVGIVRLGAFRNGMWYLDYNGDGQWSGCGTTADTDRCYTYGMLGDIPVVGDWNGNGVSKIGVFRNGMWYLDYSGTYAATGTWAGCGAPTDPTKAACIAFGTAGDIPVAGNWNGSADGESKIGVFRNGMWYLDYSGTYALTGTWAGCGAPADPTKAACIAFGTVGDIPVVGDWNGSADGESKIGVFRNGTWYLDYPGTYSATSTWLGCGAPADGSKDACVPFGMSGDLPVVLR